MYERMNYIFFCSSPDIPLFSNDLEAHLLLVYLNAHLTEEFYGIGIP